MNTYKIIKNKRFKAEKAFWYLTDEGALEYGPTYYIITNLGNWAFADPKRAAGFIKLLIEEGHKPCTYVRMFKVVEEHNKKVKTMLNYKFSMLQEYGYDDSDDKVQEYKRRLIEDFNDQLLDNKKAKAILKIKIKISEII